MEGADIDVERLMEEVRRRVRERKRSDAAPEPVVERAPVAISVPGDVSSLQANANVYDVVFRSHRRILGPFIVRLFEFFRLLLTPVLTRQSAYNAANARAVAGLEQEVARLAGEVRLAEERLRRGFDQRLRGFEEVTAAFEERIVKIVEEARAGVEQRLLERAKSEDERFAAIERRLRRLAHWLEEPAAEPPPPKPLPRELVEPALDGVAFQNRFRGSEEDIRERQRPYVELFHQSSEVLDVGCGRGEFLELLREAAIPASGVDLDLDMVLFCREKGLAVTHADAFEHLAALPDDSLGGVFAAQVIEHLDTSRVVPLIRLCYRKLHSGGILVVESPNPACLAVFARSFYVDLDHTRPVHSDAVRYLFEAAGFGDVEVRFLAPVEEELRLADAADGALPPELVKRFERLDGLLFGHQDYAVVGRK